MAGDSAVSFDDAFSVPASWVTEEEAPRNNKLPEFKVRGGPGSGHHGHAGRPGEVGGSTPGTGISNLRFSYSTPGGKSIEVESLEEAMRLGSQPGEYIEASGRFGATTEDGQLWFSVSFPFEDAEERGFTVDEIDMQKEVETALDAYNYFLEQMTDPTNTKAFAEGDYQGESMLRFTQGFVEQWEEIQEGDMLETFRRRFGASMNLVMVNDSERAGAGSSEVGGKNAKIFWVPVSLDADRQVLRDSYGAFVLSPVFVQMHELHHGFGSASEFDVFSTALAADYYLNNRDLLTPAIERSMVGEIAGNMNSGAERAAGDLREPRLYNRAMMGWLYSRHTGYFDTLFDERRAYNAGELEDISPEGNQFLIWKGVDRLQKKVSEWAKEYGT